MNNTSANRATTPISRTSALCHRTQNPDCVFGLGKVSVAVASKRDGYWDNPGVSR